jgi:23S rRNA pseudouridine1911/1915/1917 synthase
VSPEVPGGAEEPEAAGAPGESVTPDGADAPELRIVHLDDDLAVIDKPAGLVVHPAPSHTGPTVVSELGDLLGGGDPERPGIVHRLDKETSGLMVVARSPDTLAALQEAVRERHVERRYLALAGGRLGSRTGTIDAPIGRASKRRTRMAVSGAASREARTHFEVLELLKRESYLEARLETGRTHQIRAHFAAIGHALVGDVTYGGAPRYGLRRQFLHAHRLAFAHPRTGASLDYRSPLPDDLEAALEAARAE